MMPRATQRSVGSIKSIAESDIVRFIQQILQAVVLQAKKLGKSVYVFSVDLEQGKVAHVNHVADDAKARGLDGREWANVIVNIVGGKVRINLSIRPFVNIRHRPGGRSMGLRVSV